MKQALWCILVTFVVSACAGYQSPPAITAAKPDLPQSEQDTRDALVGNWVGYAPLKSGGQRRWLNQRYDDGGYVLTFVVKPERGEPETSQEVGLWGVSGPIYFSVMKGWIYEDQLIPSDPSDISYYDAYKIISITEERFEYESFSTGNRFVLERVSDEFSPDDL